MSINPFAEIQPIILAEQLAYIIFERKDIKKMSAFMLDFGLVECGSNGKSTFFKGFGDLPCCVEIIESDKDAFVGFGFLTDNEADFSRFAAETGVAPVESTQPGGGRVISLEDPNGFRVDLIHGITRVEPIPQRDDIKVTNSPWEKRRINSPVRTVTEPAPVRALGHVVLSVLDFQATVSWYTKHFGIIPTDMAHTGGETEMLCFGFFRLNLGDTPADHHTCAFLAGPQAGLLHVSTETIDMDAVGQGHQHLKLNGWEHHWGMGRHVQGSQIFDYWKDPAGDEWEHYSDGDMMTADYPHTVYALDRGGLWAWGHDLPPSLRPPGPAPEQAPPPVKDLVNAMLKKPRPWLD